MPTKKPTKKSAKKTAPPRKSPRKTTRKSGKVLTEWTKLDKALGVYSAAPVGGPTAQNAKPGVYFDMLASPNGYTDSRPYDPSAFEGISPVTPDLVPQKPVRGLARVKRAVRFFEDPIGVFENWRARLVTDRGTYEFIGPKRISRDLNDEGGRLELYFAKVSVTKTVRIQQLTILDGCGEVTAVGRHYDYVANPGDDVVVNYALNL
jgi:hypothetical protein